MKVVYDTTFEINLGLCSPEINGLIENLNSALATSGIDEKLICVAKQKGTLTAERIMTKQEKETYMRVFNQQAEENMFGVKIISIRRKSSKSLNKSNL